MNAPLLVPQGGPWFEGHFPGRPILPGIGLLDLALRALDPDSGAAALVSLGFLRLRRVVLPREHLEIETRPAAPAGSPGGEAALRMTVRRAGEIVAEAALSLGAAPASGAPPSRPPRGFSRPEPCEPVGSAADLDRLLPHRPPMRFVTGIEARREDGVACTARLAEHGPYPPDGPAPALVALEMAAQAAAVFAGLRASSGEEHRPEPRPGYLVGARDLVFFRRSIPAGAVCSASVRVLGRAAALSTFSFDVGCGGESVVSGTFSTWLTTTGA